MKIVKLIQTKGFHISNETCQPVDISSMESIVDHISCTNKYSFVETCSCLATFTGKTYKEIWTKVDAFAAANTYDFLTVVIKK